MRQYTFGRDGDENAITLASRWIRPAGFVIGGIASVAMLVYVIVEGAPLKVILASLAFVAIYVVLGLIFRAALRRQ